MALRLPATNHLLKDLRTQGVDALSFSAPDVPLAPGLADALAAFVLAQCR